MIKWEHWQDQFDESWHKWVKPLITSPKFDKDFSNIKEYAKQGHIVLPSSGSNNLFRVFREVKYEDVKVAVVGLSPYNKKVGHTEIADGLAMSCSSTGNLQPTLEKWYDALEREVGKVEKRADLKYLAEEGVFLYNYALTCGLGDPDVHVDYWEWFSKELFRTAISEKDVPVITMGKVAAEVLGQIMPWQPYWELEHPSYAARQQRAWDNKNCFTESKVIINKKGLPFTWAIQKEVF